MAVLSINLNRRSDLRMNVYDLGHVPWLDSQLIYHALPRLGVEGLILLTPAQPYVCIGYHQDVEQEVDLAFCEQQGIPVFRREVGGGAVFLDGNQIFFQLVIHQENPLARGSKADFYRRMLAPVVQAYRDLGVDVHYRPVNDIITSQGRKISGTGAAEINDFLILVGNLIADFDYETMVRVLRVPDAKFRDKVFRSMRENLTTLHRELGEVPPWDEMIGALRRNFSVALGELTSADLPAVVQAQVAELAGTHTTDAWLRKPGNRLRSGRAVKIAEGVQVVNHMYKAPGGLIRTNLEMRNGRVSGAEISGDFFFYPAERLVDLEQHLVGVAPAEVRRAIEQFYQDFEVESPGVTPQDLAIALGCIDPEV
jgi:lipoate-protein ligase A